MKSIPVCHPNKKYGARGKCALCYNTWLRQVNPAYKAACYAASKKVQLAHPERRQNYWLKYRYNITKIEADKMKDDQNNKCLICLRLKELVVDHNHVTGKVRGMICNVCNMYVGVIENTNGTVKRLSNYLSIAV